MFFQPTPRNKFTQPVNLSLLWICTTVQLIVLPFLQDASMAAAFTQSFSDSAAQPLLWRRRALHCLEYRSLFLWWFLTPVVWSAAPVVWLPTDGRVEWWREKKKQKKQPSETALLSGLTRWGWLDLDLLPAVPSSYAAAAAAAVHRRLLSPLHLALIGEQILDVLLLERAGRAAGRAHIQVGRQLAPLLVFVYLSGGGQDISESNEECRVHHPLFVLMHSGGISHSLVIAHAGRLTTACWICFK